MSHHVFVFGTLKEGFPNFATNKGRRLPGSFVTLQRFPFHLMGERFVPWLMNSPGQGERIVGQVFEVDDDALAAMDTLERIHEPDGYRRLLIEVESDELPLRKRNAFAYLKQAEHFNPAESRSGPFAEYTLAHAALYRSRGPVGVIVLDLDGVVIQSNFIKHRAMLMLFDGAPEHREAISDYILAHGGVPRKEKIATILARILGTEPTPERLAQYLVRYASELDRLLAKAPLVPGMAELLARNDYTFYLSSSAPEAEVAYQLERTGLRQRFSAVFGSDTPKADALREVKLRHPGMTPVFFGDSVGDWQAAIAAEVPFIAVASERDNFESHAVVKIDSFNSLTQVRECMNKALGDSARARSRSL